MYQQWTVESNGIARKGVDAGVCDTSLRILKPVFPTMDELSGVTLIHLKGAIEVQHLDREPLAGGLDERLLKGADCVALSGVERVAVTYPEGRKLNVLRRYDGKVHASIHEIKLPPNPWEAFPDGSIERRAEKWLCHGMTNIASETLCKHLTGRGVILRAEYNHPRNPAELGRCIRFLDFVPQARQSLSKMRAVSPAWDAVIGKWGMLEHAWREGVKSGKFDRVSELLAEVVGDEPGRQMRARI